MGELDKELCEVFSQLQKESPRVAEKILDLVRVLVEEEQSFLQIGKEVT